MGTAGGAREVYLIELGMATAIGMQMDVQKPELNAILSVSDDWYEFAVIALAGVLSGTSGAIGRRTLVEDIQNHLSLHRKFRPEFTALDTQLGKGGVHADAVSELPGWETWAGRTELGRQTAHSITSEDMTLGMMPSLVRLTERIKQTIRLLPNEKQYPLSRATIHATGTSLSIPGFDSLLASQLGYSVKRFDSEIHPSIDGCRIVLKELKFLKRIKTFR
jgi:rod shape-determining protein MreB